MKTSIIVDREDIRKVEEEEQYLFVRQVLLQIGLPLEEVLPEDQTKFDLDHKKQLRQILRKFGVSVIYDRDGGIKIYTDVTTSSESDQQFLLTAEWKKCRFDLRQDMTAIDPSKKMYAVVHIDYWTVFENQG